jgi:hypothetical protein
MKKNNNEQLNNHSTAAATRTQKGPYNKTSLKDAPTSISKLNITSHHNFETWADLISPALA